MKIKDQKIKSVIIVGFAGVFFSICFDLAFNFPITTFHPTVFLSFILGGLAYKYS